MAIIGSMVAIVLHERSRVQKIENESIAIFQTQHNINTTHRYVTTLVTYGESVMVWNDEDSGAYRERRVRTDSMLQTLRTQCKDFIQPEQIDSLRTLLAAKEDSVLSITRLPHPFKIKACSFFTGLLTVEVTHGESVISHSVDKVFNIIHAVCVELFIEFQAANFKEILFHRLTGFAVGDRDIHDFVVFVNKARHNF